MSLGAEQTKLIADYTMNDYERERDITKRVIAAIPAKGEDYTPNAKSRQALDLAWHIASTEVWFLNSISDARFGSSEPNRPEQLRNSQDVLAWYDQNAPKALERTRSLSGEQLGKELDFFGKMQAPAVAYLTLMVKHTVHHRGQLSTYLRPMGAKVPSIYGPSADTQ